MIFAALALLYGAAAYAQDCTYWVETDEPVVMYCNGTGGRIGGRWSVDIAWDWNENGPDLTDPLAPVGDSPGQYNFNQFEFGEDWTGFFESPCWIVNGAPPSHPFFYIRIWAGHDSSCRRSVWMSSVITHLPGPQDIECSGWTCIYDYDDSWLFSRPTELAVRLIPGNLVRLAWIRPPCGFPDGYYVYRSDNGWWIPHDSTDRWGFTTETTFIDTLPEILPAQMFWEVWAYFDDD